ncbi:hypothetical protein [Sphingobacterium sp. BN32]|uniref:hypothetical protein n=1 Tax=Sphingobacterium sp. BN32 TaxID=3058432 RepID=UPI00265C8D8B|nr:hypothetical protein [Sphingobacterium sp. BN32]WKK58743.1 hypothetical protein QYC40_00605 [Sphingobacterium sp. BN32]
MKNYNVSELSNRQLNIQRRNSYNFVLASLMLNIIMLSFATIYLNQQQDIVLPVLVIASILSTLPGLLKLREIKQELRTRTQRVI